VLVSLLSSAPMEGKHVLCTGGAGYIGSHTVLKLIQNGARVSILDNHLNSSPIAVERLRKIAARDFPGKNVEVELYNVDLLDKDAVEKLFAGTQFDAVVHFAGLKAVGESVEQPLWYYHNNITGTLHLLEAMRKNNCKAIVFSSSATVYQACEEALDESKPLGASNPYGQTKFMIEQILRDLCVADKAFAVSILRYFNPVGNIASGEIGESPQGRPNNLLPFIQQVGVGRREKLTVFGSDYPTSDGTGVRDYIHVEDLAEGHVAALGKLFEVGAGCLTHNLGSGNGFSVFEMIKAFEQASGKEIKYEVGPRRPGDLAKVIADPSKANTELKWKTTRNIDEIMASAWKWQSTNPMGYEDPATLTQAKAAGAAGGEAGGMDHEGKDKYTG